MKIKSLLNWKLLLIVTIILVILSQLNRAKAQISPPEIVRVSVLHTDCNPSSLPLLVGLSRGFFENEGLTIKTINQKLDNAEEQKYDQDTDVILLGRAEQYYLEATQPGSFLIFAANFLTKSQPNYAILVRKDSPIKSLADLSGKTVGLEQYSGRAKFVLMKIILQKNNIDPATVSLKLFSVAEVDKDKLDALYIREPELSRILNTGNYQILVNEPVGRYVMDPWPMSFASFSQKFATQRPAAATQVVTAWNNAIGFIRANPNEAEKLLQQCAKSKYGSELNIGQLSHWKRAEINQDIIQKQMDLYYQTGLIPNQISVSKLLY